MKRARLKVARIGNSRGVRIPATTLARYRIGTAVVMEERAEGILLRPSGSPDSKLSWEDTAAEMFRAAEDWSDWDRIALDGIEKMEWSSRPARHVAENRASYRRKSRAGRRR